MVPTALSPRCHSSGTGRTSEREPDRRECWGRTKSPRMISIVSGRARLTSRCPPTSAWSERERCVIYSVVLDVAISKTSGIFKLLLPHTCSCVSHISVLICSPTGISQNSGKWLVLLKWPFLSFTWHLCRNHCFTVMKLSKKKKTDKWWHKSICPESHQEVKRRPPNIH